MIRAASISILVTIAALILASCGFNPVHSTAKMADKSAFKSIKVEMVEPERIAHKEAGYHLQQHLYDRLGQNSGPHILRLEARPGRRPYGLNSNDVATRYDMRLRVDYSLIDSVSGEKLLSGRLSAVTTFGSSRDPYARISAEQTATEQVARDAADRLLVRLASYYNDPAKYKAAEAEKQRLRLEKQAEKERAQSEGRALVDDDDIVDLPDF